MASKDNTKATDVTISIDEYGDVGEVKIASDVVATIAALAAAEVDGVYSMGGTLSDDIVAMFGGKKIQKGVKVVLENTKVKLGISIAIMYGKSIPKVSKEVQQRAKTQVESMTGLEVEKVDVKITGIKYED
ncbi:MAG: Asp23/Gls24 family envelope stress response protein [Lachnospiraceae bacterium]|nr:Asp23/Gls24 family envelope stress response protein [Lachnospiraceae bacterium]